MAENLIKRITLDDKDGHQESSEEIENSATTEGEFMPTSVELPSKVTEKDYIYSPSSFENFEERDEWKSSGKWLLFSHGDIQKLDFWWTYLQPLLASETLICIKSSTAKDVEQKGVILCYTSNCEDKESVKKAADAIRNVAKYEYLMYYKTNEASQSGLYKMHGDQNITKYMHTVACSLYEKDNYNRWRNYN